MKKILQLLFVITMMFIPSFSLIAQSIPEDIPLVYTACSENL